jgi:hypothetical protein
MHLWNKYFPRVKDLFFFTSLKFLGALVYQTTRQTGFSLGFANVKRESGLAVVTCFVTNLDNLAPFEGRIVVLKSCRILYFYYMLVPMSCTNISLYTIF